MRWIGMLILFLCLFAASACAEDTPYSILADTLLKLDPSVEVFTHEEADALRNELSEAGIDVPELPEGTIYKYDFSLDLLEAAWGNFYDWSIEKKHLFDQLMVNTGQLDACFNLLPDEHEISQADARALAFTEIQNRYGIEPQALAAQADIDYSYALSSAPPCEPAWRLGIAFEQRVFFVEVLDGEVHTCSEFVVSGDLEEEYIALREEKGAFFTWTLEDKMAFADSLPEKLAQAQASGALIPSDIELNAIANYGFCLPGESAIPQDEALNIAIEATTSAFSLENGWEQTAEIYYSFFRNETQGTVWRVIFWKAKQDNYPSGLVDLNAETGEVLRVAKNGVLPNDYIPYVDRL